MFPNWRAVDWRFLSTGMHQKQQPRAYISRIVECLRMVVLQRFVYTGIGAIVLRWMDIYQSGQKVEIDKNFTLYVMSVTAVVSSFVLRLLHHTIFKRIQHHLNMPPTTSISHRRVTFLQGRHRSASWIAMSNSVQASLGTRHLDVPQLTFHYRAVGAEEAKSPSMRFHRLKRPVWGEWV